ncbi:MAG TPA: hypothetical protein VGF98_11055 [Candidatus Tumulicola sp.]|jgi:hypothetical protein
MASVGSDEFFAGFLAGVALLRLRLTGGRVVLNRAFWSALKAPEGDFVDRDALAIDYDPLYAVSPWFERALTRAQRDLLIGFPNPSYQDVEIRLSPEQAQQLLRATPDGEKLKALAKRFVENISCAAS